MSLPLHELAQDGDGDGIVRMTLEDLGRPIEAPHVVTTLNPKLIPDRPLKDGEQYRFHFNVTKCIGCRSCEVACNEQNGNPADILWRRSKLGLRFSVAEEQALARHLEGATDQFAQA